MLPSELTNTIEQFMLDLLRNKTHFTYILCISYIFEADNIDNNPPPNVISPIFLLFLFLSDAPPSTLLTAEALTDPQLPTTASNVCTADAKLGGVGQVTPPPNKNPGYAGGRDKHYRHVFASFVCRGMTTSMSSSFDCRPHYFVTMRSSCRPSRGTAARRDPCSRQSSR